MRGQTIRLTTLVVALLLTLAACIPGLGTMEPLQVTVETPHIATVTFTPTVNAVDVIIFVGGADTVRTEHVAFECEPYRQGHRCSVPGQEDASVPRFISPAGQPIQIIAYADRAAGVTGSVFWSATP